MKKRFILIVLVFFVMLAGISAQTFTWINPYTNIGTYPASMLSFVSSGIWYDEIDILGPATSELSNYSGYNIFTAYGNYYQWNSPTAAFNVNPFATTTFTPGGSYMLGLIMPFMSYRLGFGTGFSLTTVDGMAIGADTNSTTGTQSVWTNTQNHTEDSAPLDGTADWTSSNTENYTDFYSINMAGGTTGIDLGFLGLSLTASLTSQRRALGGSYVYTWAEGATAALNDEITRKAVYFGSADGSVISWPSAASSWFVQINGDLKPLQVFGILLPLRGNILFGGLPSGSPSYNPPMTVAYTTTNVTGASTATDNSTLSYTVGQVMNTGWDPDTTAGVLAVNSQQTRTTAQLRSDIDTAYASSAALDTTGYKNTNFTTGLEVQADPQIEVNNVFKVRTRVDVMYNLSVSDNTQAATQSINYSESNSAANPSVFTYTKTVTAPSKNTSHTIASEVGGILEFNDPSGFVQIGAGFFYDPSIVLSSTDMSGAVTNEAFSWTDTTGTDPVADATVTDASWICPSGSIAASAGNEHQGSSTRVTTTTYNGNKISNTYKHDFYIPVGITLNIKKDKLKLIGGYTLNHEIKIEYVRTPSGSVDVDTIINDTAGNEVYTQTGQSVTTQVEETTWKTTTAWNGIMSFMLRWMLNESMTVDFFGNSIMNALNFSIFGGGGGFNPNTFISTLGLSVSFHIPSK